MTKTITALQDTILKHSPVDSTLLTDGEKSNFRRGATHPVIKAEVVGNHVKFWLGKDDKGKQVWINNRQIWFAFRPHVLIDGDGHKISEKGLKLIRDFEGCKLRAYRCPAGVWTIGYGSTGAHVYEGLTITQEQAERLLLEDLERFEDAVNDLVKVPLTQSAYDALVSFAFNCGIGALETSTLLKMFNDGEYKAAADQLLRWDKAGGKALPGLTRRRQAERDLWLSEPSPLPRS